MPVRFSVAGPEEEETVLSLMREFYEIEHLTFTEQAARGALRQLLAGHEHGMVALMHAGEELAADSAGRAHTVLRVLTGHRECLLLDGTAPCGACRRGVGGPLRATDGPGRPSVSGSAGASRRSSSPRARGASPAPPPTAPRCAGG